MPQSSVRSGHTSVTNEPESADFPPVVQIQEDAPESRMENEASYADSESALANSAPTPEAIDIERAPDTSGLPEIGLASYSEPVPESIQGRDDRRQVDNTDEYPWRVHASLLITTDSNKQYIGTGWFVSPRVLITAGHCVYIKNSGWVKSILVMPGRNGSELPFGSEKAVRFRAASGWTNDGNPDYDYGAIILNSDLGNRTGWIGVGSYDDEFLKNTRLHVAGYPGDKPSGTQWYDSKPKATAVSNRRVYYAADTVGGNSGGAVYVIKDNQRFAVAIHAYGGQSSNSGARINVQVHNNIRAWKNV